MNRILVLFFSLAALQGCLSAEAYDSASVAGPKIEHPNYHFFQPVTYGSASLIHPLRLIFNGGFGITQLDNVDNHILEYPYKTGFNNVWLNVTHPIETIESVGWRDFVLQEVIPFGVDREKAQFWPNYFNHLIGGGMSYRMMVEWFDHNGYRYPTIWGLGTITAYHILNEVVENGGKKTYNSDAIADLCIFNPLGIALFSSEAVCDFFGSTLNLRDWSYQIAYDPWDQTIVNNGQNFVMKYPLPWWDRWSLFYHWGTHGEFGLSYRKENGDAWSMGVGLKASKLVDLAEGRRTVDLVVAAGLFYDRENSLMASLLYSGTKRDRLRLNIYPGLLNIWSMAPGIFAAVDQDSKISVGLDLHLLPVPFGVAYTAR